jgi:hypothetical protein
MQPEWTNRLLSLLRRHGIERRRKLLHVHNPPSERPIIFVTNVVRSGSTLTQVVLSGHPEVCICPEAAWLDRFFALEPRSSRMSGHTLKRFAADVAKDSKLNSWKVDTTDFRANLNDEKNVDIRDFTHQLFERYAQEMHPDASRLGMKKGSLLPYWRDILRLWPRTKLLFTVRDPRDSVPSAVAKLPRSNVAQQCRYWNQRVEIALTAARQQPTRMRIFRYEDLALQPEATAREMCRFLDIVYTPEMIDTDAGNRAYQQVGKGYEQLHQRTNQRIDAARVYSWKHARSDSPTADIEHWTSAHLDALGYERSKQRRAA